MPPFARLPLLKRSLCRTSSRRAQVVKRWWRWHRAVLSVFGWQHCCSTVSIRRCISVCTVAQDRETERLLIPNDETIFVTAAASTGGNNNKIVFLYDYSLVCLQSQLQIAENRNMTTDPAHGGCITGQFSTIVKDLSLKGG